MDALDREDREEGGPGVRFGICLHRGEVVYGNIGAPDRLDFTVIGRAVNQASRIEGLCRSLGESTLLSPEFAACVPELVRPVGPQQLCGVRDPVMLFALRAPVTELSDES
jgi:adenylate cyclase